MKKVKPQPLSPYLDEREQQIQADYEWCWHDPEMQKAIPMFSRRRSPWVCR